MGKREHLAFLFCLILCYSLFQPTARARSSSQISISFQGSITYPQNVNLAVIPDGWYLTFGSGPQIIYLDYNVTRTAGKPSIRLEPHVEGVDVNTARECDTKGHSVKPGDHIIAKCWIKIDDNGDTNPYHGARIGIDLKGVVDGNRVILDSYPHYGQNVMVMWGTETWTLRTWDIVVPATEYTQTTSGLAIPPTQISSINMWMQVLPTTAPGNAWFADAELYVNPI